MLREKLVRRVISVLRLGPSDWTLEHVGSFAGSAEAIRMGTRRSEYRVLAGIGGKDVEKFP